MKKDYRKFSQRSLEALESRYGHEITKLRDKYQDTKSRYDKELKALQNKVNREIRAFTNKMNRELIAFEKKMKRELDSIKKQGEKKTEERQRINDILNKRAFENQTQSQELQEPDNSNPTVQWRD